MKFDEKALESQVREFDNASFATLLGIIADFETKPTICILLREAAKRMEETDRALRHYQKVEREKLMQIGKGAV